jgi:hypothetical protein
MAMDEREEARLFDELGPRAWMWLKAENDPGVGFELVTLWKLLKPLNSEFSSLTGQLSC